MLFSAVSLYIHSYSQLSTTDWYYLMRGQSDMSYTHKKHSHYNWHAIHPSFGQTKKERIKAAITFKGKSYQSFLYIAAA